MKTLEFEANSTLVEIGQGAFQGTGVQSVELPASLTLIKENAFRSSLLQSVRFEENSQLQEIWNFAFAECAHMASFTFPVDVRMIGEAAFRMTGLQEVTLPSHLVSLGTGALPHVTI